MKKAQQIRIISTRGHAKRNPPIALLTLITVFSSAFFAFEAVAIELGRAYHMTASDSPNLSEVHIINTSPSATTFTGTLFHKSGSQLGASNVALHEGLIEPQGRLILFSTDLEQRFNHLPWTGPAMLDVNSRNQFEVMTKLSRNGRVTNTNCVRTDNVHNLEGTDSPDVSYIRFINDGVTALANIRGTLYDSDGNTIGQPDALFLEELGARAAIFLSRDSISNVIGATWTGVASLELSATYENLKLMNLNFVNGETFFNFSCYEASNSVPNDEVFQSSMIGAVKGSNVQSFNGFASAGSQFAITISNDSNYTIELLVFQATNRQGKLLGYFTATDRPDLLNNGSLAPGEATGVTVTIQEAEEFPITMSFEYVHPEDGSDASGNIEVISVTHDDPGG